jgi:hypothetical protein
LWIRTPAVCLGPSRSSVGPSPNSATAPASSSKQDRDLKHEMPEPGRASTPSGSLLFVRSGECYFGFALACSMKWRSTALMRVW